VLAAGMPSRPYSALIIGGLWPMSDPAAWVQSGTALADKGNDLLGHAHTIRHSANNVVGEGQSGHTIDGFVDACHRNARTVTSHADQYFDMSDSAHEIARTIDGLRQDLDQIDEQANEEIQRVLSSGGGALTAAAQTAMLNAIVTQARAAATEKHTVAAAAIAAQSASIAGEAAATAV
jgi:sugar (pentulose or hexulose) kinase